MNPLPTQSLVVFKNQAARITFSGDKLELVLANGQSAKVRPKDVTFLHKGPFEFSQLKEDFSQLETAWELAQGECLGLGDLSELLCGESSAKAAWNVWLLLQDDLYFEGDLEKPVARSPEAVNLRREHRANKQKEQEAQQAFWGRLEQRNILPEDHGLLREVEDVALELRETSNILKHLQINQLSTAARQFLVELGYWRETTDLNAVRALRDRSFEPSVKYGEKVSQNTENINIENFNIENINKNNNIENINKNNNIENINNIKNIKNINMCSPHPDTPRLDLTHLTAWAIDDQDSKDPDDAIGLEGEFLWVHIADVADIVTIDSPIDLEARERAANLYLPEWTSPMLPEMITLERGLGLHGISKALSFKISRDSEGRAQLEQWGPSIVRVTRTSYGQADIDVQHNQAMERCFSLLKAFDDWRRSQGALELNLPEVKVMARNPDAVDVRPLDDGLSRLAVKNAMLMCGQAVARWADEHHLPVPFSHQGPPKVSEAPVFLNPLIPHEAFALRRCMQGAEQSCDPGAHSGLGLEPYVQCTSPLRRYGDLLVHQQLRAFYFGQPARSREQLEQALSGSREMARNLRRLERRSNLHWTLVWLLQQGTWEGEALVVEVEDRGVKVLIESLALEQKIFPDFAVVTGQHCWLRLKKVDLLGEKALFQVSHMPKA